MDHTCDENRARSVAAEYLHLVMSFANFMVTLPAVLDIVSGEPSGSHVKEAIRKLQQERHAKSPRANSGRHQPQRPQSIQMVDMKQQPNNVARSEDYAVAPTTQPSNIEAQV